MKFACASKHRRAGAIAWGIALIMATFCAHSTTHVIQFGGSFGFTYSPSSLNVLVGDTVKWEGDFSMHPLSSTGVPAGALSFHNGSGSVFAYPIKIAGTYHYQCDNHFSFGMIGSFVAATTGVEEKQTSLQPGSFRLEQNFPNPFNSSTVIGFSLPVSQRATLKVYSMLGREIATLADGIMPAGDFTVRVDGNKMQSGIYYYRLVTDQSTETKRLILLK
jgi:plastocyanin